MDLSSYIEKLGDAKAAKLFGVKTRTAAAWRRGERKPRPKQAQKIIKSANGELTFESVYAGRHQ